MYTFKIQRPLGKIFSFNAVRNASVPSKSDAVSTEAGVTGIQLS